MLFGLIKGRQHWRWRIGAVPSAAELAAAAAALRRPGAKAADEREAVLRHLADAAAHAATAAALCSCDLIDAAAEAAHPDAKPSQATVEVRAGQVQSSCRCASRRPPRVLPPAPALHPSRMQSATTLLGRPPQRWRPASPPRRMPSPPRSPTARFWARWRLPWRRPPQPSAPTPSWTYWPASAWPPPAALCARRSVVALVAAHHAFCCSCRLERLPASRRLARSLIKAVPRLPSAPSLPQMEREGAPAATVAALRAATEVGDWPLAGEAAWALEIMGGMSRRLTREIGWVGG